MIVKLRLKVVLTLDFFQWVMKEVYLIQDAIICVICTLKEHYGTYF